MKCEIKLEINLKPCPFVFSSYSLPAKFDPIFVFYRKLFCFFWKLARGEHSSFVCCFSRFYSRGKKKKIFKIGSEDSPRRKHKHESN